MDRFTLIFLFILSLIFIDSTHAAIGDYVISGELRKWHKITIDFEGPQSSETDNTNPFADIRFNVTFTNGSESFKVPGFFAADGNAENSGATSGDVWRVHFAPNKTGTWNFEVEFVEGDDAAIGTGGNSVSGIHGVSGSFNVSNTNKSGRDFRGKGRLNYVGQHYLQFAETEEYFLKVGADAPENTFAYEDFDATPNAGGRRKNWNLHAGDFNLSDASAYTWGSMENDGARAKGRELLGAFKYMADEGMNAISFLTFSLDGDDDNVYPHRQQQNNATSWNNVDHDRFDISKMAQWEKIMEYADKIGIYLHFKMQETENDQKMDGGQLGRERKLYYRQLIAQFGHHLALNWNLGEENDIWTELNDPNNNIVKSYTQFFFDNDPYRHNVVIHTYPGQQDDVYNDLLGNASKLTGTSVQSGINNVHKDVKEWVEKSALNNKKWVVANDEQGGADIGAAVDDNYPDNQLPETNNRADNRDDIRKKVLWGTLMAGGAGVEYYYGYQTGCDDLDCEDHRTRALKWSDCRQALNFFNTYIIDNILSFKSNDDLTTDSDDYVFTNGNTKYVIFLPEGGTTNLDLENNEFSYQVKWYNPRNGGSLQNGSITSISGPGEKSIGNPPNNTNSDWAVLITSDDCPPAGQSCDDGDPSTFDDETDGNCGCQGTPCPVAGTACDDGNPNTINDQEDGFCNCTGTDPNAPEFWLEAECAIVGNQWTLMNDNNASGGKYLAPPNSLSTGSPPTNTADIVKFIVNISEPGVYTIYSRNVTTGDGDDSYWVRINNGNWINWNKINFPYPNDNYTWNQVSSWTSGDITTPLTFNLSAGLNDIEFSWREPGIKFDKLFLSRTETPSGLGGVALNCADCVNNYSGQNALNGNISGVQYYQTSGQLESAQIINGSSTSIFYSSPINSTLMNGFETIVGAELLIFVEGCN